MSRMVVYAESQSGSPREVETDPKRISALLRARGVRFEQWSTAQDLPVDADQARVLDAYRADVSRLQSEYGYRASDVMRLKRGAPNAVAARAKFLQEHVHTEDEIRFFVEGSGSFYMHFEGEIVQVVCTRGDIISVPAGTRHWFDMGTDPHFCAIRLFMNPDGWVAQFTGSDISQAFPTHDQVTAS